MAEEGTKISAATTTTPVSTDMIPFSRVADATARHMTVAALDTYLFDRAVVINEFGADVDTRIEAVGQANALFVQGSDGFVGIGTGTPGVKLDIAGNARISQGNNLRFPHASESGADDGKIGVALYDTGLNLIGSRTDEAYRKFSLWGEITQQQNDGTNTWLGINTFSGNVGIGTATPGKRLDVYNTDNSGAIRARGSAYTKIIVEGSTAPTYVLADTGETDPAGRFAIWTESDLLKFGRFATADFGSWSAKLTMTATGYVGIGLTPTANMAGLSIEAGLLTLKETTTPTADTNYGKLYTKDDNNLYFQSGAGVEYAIYMIEPA